MQFAVAVPNSPIFSPSQIQSLFCNSAASACTSCPRIHGGAPVSSPRSPSVSSSTDSPTSSLLFPIEEHEDGNGGSVLKRKRPTKLNIPLTGMSRFKLPMTPRGEDRLDEVEVEGEAYSVYCKRGRRGSSMEDRYSAAVDLNGNPKQAVFGVFDGHGGSKAAEFAAKNLDKNIMAEVSGRCEEGFETAIRNAYLTTDSDFLKENVGGGTCSVTALIQEGNLVVSNAGDCRAVLSSGGAAEGLTLDHHPSRTDEKDRIEALGGYVDCYKGVWRIQGSLAVSRGLGDRKYKPWVIPEPETKVIRIKPEHEFLILASDGLWEKVSNQEAVDVVRSFLVGVDKPEPVSACKKLVELSVRRSSMDDISVVLIQLGHFIS